MRKLLLTIIFLFWATVAFSATVELSWNANTEPDMASYNIYQGNTLIGNVIHPQRTFDVNNLPDGTYSFQVSAVDTSGNESVKSDSVSIKIDTTAPAKPTGLKAIIAKIVAWLKSLRG